MSAKAHGYCTKNTALAAKPSGARAIALASNVMRWPKACDAQGRKTSA